MKWRSTITASDLSGFSCTLFCMYRSLMSEVHRPQSKQWQPSGCVISTHGQIELCVVSILVYCMPCSAMMLPTVLEYRGSSTDLLRTPMTDYISAYTGIRHVDFVTLTFNLWTLQYLSMRDTFPSRLKNVSPSVHLLWKILKALWPWTSTPSPWNGTWVTNTTQNLYTKYKLSITFYTWVISLDDTHCWPLTFQLQKLHM